MKAELIKKAIDNKGQSIRKFAESIGIPSTTLQSAIDNDKFAKMQIGTVIKICDALNLDVKTFQPIPPIAEINNFDESEILAMYRHAEPHIKQTVRTILESCGSSVKGGTG